MTRPVLHTAMLCLVTATAVSAQAPAALTNNDILRMVQAGFGDAILLATVRTATATRFDLSPDGLITLKKGGVSDGIVAVMLDPKAAPAPPPPAAAMNRADSPPAETRPRVESATARPEMHRDPGVYWSKGRAGAHQLVVLEPTVFSQAKSGGFFTAAMTYGIVKAKWKAIARNSAAAFHIPESRPVFYFYFENKSSGLGNTGGFAGWLASATSPNEFTLARMTSKRYEREFIVGEMGAFGVSSGARSRDTIALDVERVSGGVYRVTPAEPLEPGEYCFFYAGGVNTLGPGTAGIGKLFDFGIYDETAR